jgi:hypothetical protein
LRKLPRRREGEIIVVDLVSSALTALRLALLAEHPLLDDELAAIDDPPSVAARGNCSVTQSNFAGPLAPTEEASMPCCKVRTKRTSLSNRWNPQTSRLTSPPSSWRRSLPEGAAPHTPP